ncbi:MAG TPA: RagB/SusD family nutrient uptake outer membrane protein [Puia sp.]
MKHKINWTLIGLTLFFAACKKDFGNLNNATVEAFTNNATQGELNNLVSGTESGMRNNLALYLDDCGILGREMYHFSPSEPRFVTDMLGASGATLSNSNFYITNPWASRYQVVKNCNVLIESATNSKTITAAQRAGYIGFAQTIKAYQLLMCLNLTDSNGIRVNVSDPNNLGPFVSVSDGMTAVASLLDSAAAQLSTASVAFTLAGFGNYGNAAGLAKFNRALAARVAVYRSQWGQALTNLNGSFFSLNGSLADGVFHVFGTGSGDQLNQFYIPQNTSGEVRVAHPSYAADIAGSDDRIGKATVRVTGASLQGLSSNRDVWVYTTSTAPIPIIRNEELVLIYAEAKIQGNAFPDAIVALNVIRAAHNLSPYSGAVTKTALINELLYERRYSLYCEGHRWIDLRRYQLLGSLPKDRPGDQVWTRFPIPISEGAR